MPGDGPRRYALADYIRKRHPDAFDTAILDECHQLKAKGSAQGIAAAGIAERTRRVIALTGTLFGAYSSTLFYLRYRFSRALSGEFGYHDEPKWISRYGIAETIKKYDGDVSDGAMSKRKLISTRTVEKPGISPAVLFYLVGDTVFVRLEDVERDLPPYTEHVRLMTLDRESGQEEEYRSLATRMQGEVRAALAAGSKRLLGAYLQALLSYPDACHRGEVVLDKRTGRVLAEAAELDADRLYPKERELVELCRRERACGRRVLVYASHTGERDITLRLEGMLREEGLRVRVLKASVRAESREDWVSARVSEGLDVLITNPRCVETGLDLIAFPTLVFYETEYSVFTLRQAAKRSWRIGQTQPVEVYYWAYEHTLQADALSLIASKLRWSLMIEGDLGDVGLGGMGAGSDDVMTALARRLAEQEGVAAESVEALFAESRSAREEGGEYLDEGWCDEELPEPLQLSVVGSPELTPDPTPEQLASLWTRVFSGEEVEQVAPPAATAPTARAVTWEELAARVRPRKPGRARRRPEGQLELLDLAG